MKTFSEKEIENIMEIEGHELFISIRVPRKHTKLALKWFSLRTIPVAFTRFLTTKYFLQSPYVIPSLSRF